MVYVNKMRSWTTAILHLFSQEKDILIKVIMKYVNLKLWDILDCFHYILNAPRISDSISQDILLQIFGVIQSDIMLQKQVH